MPTGLAASVDRQGRVQLGWNAASDALTGVAAYRILRDGAAIGQAAGTSYTDTGAAAGTTYVYAVAAIDGAGNLSAASAGVAVTTPAAKGNGKGAKGSGPHARFPKVAGLMDGAEHDVLAHRAVPREHGPPLASTNPP